MSLPTANILESAQTARVDQPPVPAGFRRVPDAPISLNWTTLPRAGAAQRALAGAIALLAWGVLAAAGLLTPRADGSGTHEQFGVPPCYSKVISGYPCPSCGMTTAFAFFVRGDLPAALRAQVLGAALAAVTLLAGLGGTVMAATGVHLGGVLDAIFVQRVEWLYVLAALVLGSWGLKAWMGW